MNYLEQIKNFYQKLPNGVKKIVSYIPPYALLGASYRKHCKFLDISNKWSGKELAQHQEKLLFDMVEFAATTVPYYRDLFLKLGLCSRLRSMDEFYRIPYLTKEIILSEKNRMVSDAVPLKSRYIVTTGGTCGTPMEFWMSSDAYAKEWAFVHDLNRRFGIEPTDRKIGLRGVPFLHANKGVYFQLNPVYRELQLSPFHLTEEVVNSLKKEILDFQPRYIHGYPSAVSELARLATEGRWGQSLNLKGVLVISEPVFSFQEQLIKEVFGCDVFSFYGHTERLVFAGNAPGISDFMVDPRYGYAEEFDGELVGTGFLNKAMPMLRYRTGDGVKFITTINHTESGIQSFPKIYKIEGRWLQEIVIGKNGNRISVTALNMHSDLFKNVIRFQYRQKNAGELLLVVIPKPGFKDEDKIKINNAFKNKLGNSIDLQIITTFEIPLTKRGKHRFLIQEINLKN